MSWVGHQIMHHLHRLSLNQRNVVFIDHVFHKELMDGFATLAPVVRILHEEKVVAIGYQFVANVRVRPVVVYAGLLIH